MQHRGVAEPVPAPRRTRACGPASVGLRIPPRGRRKGQRESLGATVTGWINAVAAMEPAHAREFQRIVEEQVSGQDVTYWSEDRLSVVLPTDVDEVLFRLALLHDTSVDEICMVGERSY